MKWQGKEIIDLSDDDLLAACQQVADMDNFTFDKLNDPRISTEGHRLHKVFSKNPPKQNPVFVQLVAELNSEMLKRKLNYAS